MSAHSKGSWIRFTANGKDTAILPAGRPGEICSFTEGREPSRENAKLMAAAPALLAALNAFPDRADFVHDEDYWEEVEIWYQGYAKTAISLATGSVQ